MLQIDNNPLVCDARLCWLKEAELEGWIRYNALYDDPPECANIDEYWYYVELNCTWNTVVNNNEV